MFAANNAILKSSCTQWNVPNNSDEEISALSASIQSVASSTGVDARFILAIVMQESNGCVRAPTTNYGVRNPGLMQSHDGSGTCNDASVSNPCPSSAITQMVTDGTAGTAAGDGLKQCLSLSGASDVSQYYKAARIYNSGSVDSSKNLGAGIATHCYASDIANRLLGWSSGPSACSPDTVGSLSGTAGSIPDTSSPDPVASTPEPSVTIPTSAPITAVAGGAFAEVTPPAPTADSTPTPATTPVAEPTPITEPTPIADPSPVSPAPPAETTIVVVPTPAAPTPTPSPAPAPTPAPTASGTQTPGSVCTSEGMWNCIAGSSFQQCASGTWSVVMALAAGMECKEGMSMVFGVGAVGSL